MTSPSAFNHNPELAAMRQEIADRSFKVKLKGMLISGALAIAGVAAMVLLPAVAPGALGGMMGGMGKIALGALLMGGSAIASMATMKEVKQLEIDEQYLQSYMQGKNYWGEGYREEVAEHGYGGPQVMPQGLPGRAGGPGRQS